MLKFQQQKGVSTLIGNPTDSSTLQSLGESLLVATIGEPEADQMLDSLERGSCTIFSETRFILYMQFIELQNTLDSKFYYYIE